VTVEGETALLVDFDVAESFGKQAGQGDKWVMHPVLKGSVVEPEAAAARTSSPRLPAPLSEARPEGFRASLLFAGLDSDRSIVTHAIAVSVNRKPLRSTVESRLLLSDFLRHDAGFTGTHVGCEHGVCGACTVLLDGAAVRSCLMFAVQAGRARDHHGRGTGEQWRAESLQAAFREAHGLQCGFCTPGILMSMTAFLRDHRIRKNGDS
jgi:aerobic-type carbon monoxide dehydrogenase small subunit (CoxS/CutS family)